MSVGAWKNSLFSLEISAIKAVLWAEVSFYDERGGGIETSLKGDKQGLGLTRRNKKRFEYSLLPLL